MGLNLEKMQSIYEAFTHHVDHRGHHLAVWSRCESLRWSFRALADRVDQWIDPLKELPQPIAIATGNRADFLALGLALLRLEIPFATLDGTLPFREKVATCRRLGFPTLLHAHSHGQALLGEVKWTPITEAEAFRAPQGTAVVKVTSGSTGEPSGICLTEAALLAGIRQLGQGMALSEDDRVLIAIPLSHSYGFDNGLLSLAVLGTSLILVRSIFPGPLLKALEEAEISFFPTVPPILRGLGETEWPEAIPRAKVICAGAPLPEEFANRFSARSGWSIQQFYGSTETGGISFETAPQESAAQSTVGFPLPGVTISLSPEGRVLVNSPANFCGYVGESGPGVPRTVETGDQGEWTPEGRLKLVGRCSSMLNIGGKKLSVARVEKALLGLEGVSDAAVVGVADDVRGQRVVAFMVCQNRPANFSNIAPELHPREVHYVESLPYTARGKLDRMTLQSMAEKNS